jgi:hypothetical protein
MSGVIGSYEGAQEQSDTPLPTVAARAARHAIAAAGPATLSIAQSAARLALTVTIMLGRASLFTALIAQSLH